jgi:hypothetical protein
VVTRLLEIADEVLTQLSGNGTCLVGEFRVLLGTVERDGEILLRNLPRLRTRTMKSFRHYFAFTRAAHWPVHKLDTLLGHADIRTTAIYLHAEAFDLRDEFRSLPPTLPLPARERPTS